MRFRPKNDSKLLSDPVDVELSIDEDNINKELCDQPLKYRKWSLLESECAKKLRQVELALEHRKAMVYIEAKKLEKKLTVKDVESMVTLDEEVKKLEKERIEAEELVANMKAAVRAFLQRHDALKDLAANQRKALID